MDFTVTDSALSENHIRFDKTETDIITKSTGKEVYIYPKNFKGGKVLVEGESTRTEDTFISGVLGDTEDYYGEKTEIIYNFNLTLGYIGNSVGGSGSLGGSGANLIIKVTFSDGTSTEVSIPLQEGSHTYSGKLPLKLPSLSKGPIIIEYYVKPTDENDLYYWFVDGVSYWSFTSEVTRDEIAIIPPKENKKTVIERLTIFDNCLVYTESGEQPPTPIIEPYVVIEEVLKLLDGLDIPDYSSGSDSEEDSGFDENGVGGDSFGLSDGVLIYTEEV